MIHLEVNWKDENGEPKVRRDLRPMAFNYDSSANTLAIYNNIEQWYKRIPYKLFENVTSVEYWDDDKDRV